LSLSSTSIDFTQTLEDHRVLASIGSVGDAYDNAMAESFVDSFKTELISDRVWRSRSQLELAIVEWVGWYNARRLHQSLGDLPPIEFEDAQRAGSANQNGGALGLRPRSGRCRHPGPYDHRLTQPRTSPWNPGWLTMPEPPLLSGPSSDTPAEVPTEAGPAHAKRLCSIDQRSRSGHGERSPSPDDSGTARVVLHRDKRGARA